MSSIIACRLPPEAPSGARSASPSPVCVLSPNGTGRGVLSSEDRPIDWASRRAGSTVSTTTCLPRSAARRPRAAAVVVLPTPPEPQQTMTRVRRSSMSRSTSSGGETTWLITRYLPPASDAPRPSGSLMLCLLLACDAPWRRRLPSSLVPRSSVQAAPRPSGSLMLLPDHGAQRPAGKAPRGLCRL